MVLMIPSRVFDVSIKPGAIQFSLAALTSAPNDSNREAGRD
ncbi:hypothetical protein [Dietzia cercidiphylli]|nr:hypothetical protein [Dietzia cercidiphylli]